MYAAREFNDLNTRFYISPASRELSALSDMQLRDIGLRRDELRGMALHASRESLRQVFAALFARRPLQPVLGAPVRA